jgi:hypothetical protein
MRRSGLAAVVPLALALAGCKGSHAAAAPDAGADAPVVSDAAVEAAVEASALGTVPQDDEIPPTSSDELTTRAKHLLEAVAKDDPDLAVDIEFPREGWIAMHDSPDAGKEWDNHVDERFRHSIHVLAKHADGAQFVSLELGHAVVQETPRRHGWKKPLWSVHGSRITYVVDGHTRTIVIHEMIGWRGAWYVTRLR